MATSFSGGAVVGGDSAARATGRASPDGEGDGDATVVDAVLVSGCGAAVVATAGSAVVDVAGCAVLVVVGRTVVAVALGTGRGDVVVTCAV